MSEIVGRVAPPGFGGVLAHYGASALCVDYIGTISPEGATGRMRVQDGDMLHPFDFTRIIEAGAQAGIPAISLAMCQARGREDHYIPFFSGLFNGLVWRYPRPDDDIELRVRLDELEYPRGVATILAYRDGELMLLHQFGFGAVTERIFTGRTKQVPYEERKAPLGTVFDAVWRPHGQSRERVLGRVIRPSDADGHFVPPLAQLVPKYGMMRRCFSAMAYAVNCQDASSSAYPSYAYSGIMHESERLMPGRPTALRVRLVSDLDTKGKKTRATARLYGKSPCNVCFELTADLRLVDVDAYTSGRSLLEVVGLPPDE